MRGLLACENEEQIRDFLERHPEFETVSFAERLSDALIALPRIQEEAQKGYMTLLPDEGPFDGFFMAKLRRRE